MNLAYFHIFEGETLPNVAFHAPYKAVVIINDSVSPEWQSFASDWLVESGCLYMMAWGEGCSSWDDSVDWSSLENFGYEGIPDDKFVMTTWHKDETLDEVFWFAHYAARHSDVELQSLLLIDVSKNDRNAEIIARFQRAIAE